MQELSRDAKRFNRITQFLGRISQKNYLNLLTYTLTWLLAKLTILSRKGKSKSSVEGMTNEWLRMFPEGICSIEKVEDGTGYGLVHADCSLVGTGDVNACYKMMNYDREMIEKIGGTLTVLESRANPAITQCCKVAIRPLNDQRTDLIPAHQI